MPRLFFIALLLISACAPVYIPNVRNSPMFTKAGEFQTSAQVGNGIEGQTAFAVTDHFGIMANYLYIDNGEPVEDDFVTHRFFEGAIGYFTNMDESFIEIFGGYGRGRGTSHEMSMPNSRTVTGRYHRYFVQPAFGLNKDNVQFSFASRFTMVDFYEFAAENYTCCPPSFSPLTDAKAQFFFEPAIIGRVNFASNRFFATFQGGASLKMSDKNNNFDSRGLQFAGGLGFRLGGTRKLVSRL